MTDCMLEKKMVKIKWLQNPDGYAWICVQKNTR